MSTQWWLAVVVVVLAFGLFAGFWFGMEATRAWMRPRGESWPPRERIGL